MSEIGPQKLEGQSQETLRGEDKLEILREEFVRAEREFQEKARGSLKKWLSLIFGRQQTGENEYDQKLREYETARENYYRERANLLAEKLDGILDEDEKLINLRIEEKEKSKHNFRRVFEKALKALNKSYFLPGTNFKVNLRTIIGLGLLGAGLATASTLPTLAVGLYLTRRAFSGLSSGIGIYELLTRFSEKKLEKEIRRFMESNDYKYLSSILNKESAKSAQLNEESRQLTSAEGQEALSEDQKREILDATNNLMLAIEANSLKNGLLLNSDNPYYESYNRLRELRNKLLIEEINFEKKEVENLYQYLVAQEEELSNKLKKAERADGFRKLLAVTGGAFIASGSINWLIGKSAGFFQEAYEGSKNFFKTVLNFFSYPTEEIGQQIPQEFPQVTGENLDKGDQILSGDSQTQTSLDSSSTEKPAKEPVSVENKTEVYKKEYVATIQPGGSAWKAAYSFVEEKEISMKEFREAWSNPNSGAYIGEKFVHISELDLTHPGDEVKLIKNGGLRFEVIDNPKDSYSLSTAEATETIQREGRITTKIFSKPGEIPIDKNIEESLRKAAESLPEVVDKTKGVASLEPPYPVKYFEGSWEEYINQLTNGGKGEILMKPKDGIAHEILDWDKFNRLMGYLRFNRDLLYSWINNGIHGGNVALVLENIPENNDYYILRVISTNPKMPWAQGRLLPKAVVERDIDYGVLSGMIPPTN